MQPLPVDLALPSLFAALEQGGAAVLVAPPGSGKTTRVPPALLEWGGLGPGKVLVLQPRRIAARAAARRIADERGWKLGGLVGYRTRFDTRRSAQTRIEFVTEALLLRALQADPFLEGVCAVVLDEFHERSLPLDLSLALLRSLRADARPDLTVIVMSATLDPGPVAAFLSAEVVQASGRTFPVELEFDARPSKHWLPDRVAAAVGRAFAASDSGHVLAFLPGVGEIEATARALEQRGLPPGAKLLRLHGGLSAADQDRAIQPSRSRKIVLSTNVAETSVTLDGVTAVVDSGLARIARHDPGTGASRLELEPISQASADQRAGRAGRTRAGICLRLWTEAQHASRPAADAPAVRRADLAEAYLLLADQGEQPEDFRWFEAPPRGHLDAARTLLDALAAIDGGGLSARGRSLLALPLPPRLGALVLDGAARGVAASAATVAALLTGRDPFRRVDPPEDAGDDVAWRLESVAAAEYGAAPRGTDRGALREAGKVRDQLVRAVERQAIGQPPSPSQAPPLVAALLTAFPDRVARRRRRGGLRVQLAGGSGATMNERSTVGTELLLALGLRSGGRTREASVNLAVPLEPSWLNPEDVLELRFDAEREAVVCSRVRRLGALVLDERPAKAPPGADGSSLLLEAAQQRPERALAPKPGAVRLLARLHFVARVRPDLGLCPPASWAELLPQLVLGKRSFAHLREADLKGALIGGLSWSQRSALDELAPERLKLPSGSTARLEYPEAGSPVLAARIQQLFGWAEGPKLGGQPITIQLLAPNNRPAQVTSDLAGFWSGSYAEVRKQLRGRYPKHAWPDDPAHAEPMDRPRRRR